MDEELVQIQHRRARDDGDSAPAGVAGPRGVGTHEGEMVRTETGLGHAIGIGSGHTHERAACGGGAVEESWSGGGVGGGELERRRQQRRTGG